HAPVAQARLDDGEAGGLERTEQAAEVSGVEAESGSQEPHVAPVGADLPQQTRFAERPIASEVVVVQRADALGYKPVEATDLSDGILFFDSLILVRESSGAPGAPAATGRAACRPPSGARRGRRFGRGASRAPQR